MHGSYGALSGGWPEEAMEDLTGCPGKSYQVADFDGGTRMTSLSVEMRYGTGVFNAVPEAVCVCSISWHMALCTVQRGRKSTGRNALDLGFRQRCSSRQANGELLSSPSGASNGLIKQIEPRPHVCGPSPLADLWRSILSWHSEGYLLCCSTGSLRKKKKAKGIVDMHAYTMLTVRSRLALSTISLTLLLFFLTFISLGV